MSDDGGSAAAARARARRRLIGAVVLLAVGVVVFPMLFETQPRPLPTHIPIELPARDATSPAPAVPRHAPAMAELPVPEPTVAASSPPPAGTSAPTGTAKVTAPTPDRGTSAKPPEPAVAKAEADKSDGAAKLARSEPSNPPASSPAKAASATDARAAEAQRAEAARARAALEGRSPPAASAPSAGPADAKAGRFVVQVGAFTDTNALREVRSKVEKLGLKTYTQSIDTEAGRRTRVRVGPFSDRAEAEAASARLKAAGLPGNVLTL